MRTIDIKLFRELWQMRGQALAIILVIMSGVSLFIMSLSTLDSLFLTRKNYYETNRFAEIFASLKRAPDKLHSRIEAISGVKHVDLRVIAGVNVNVSGFEEPITGQLISVPDRGEATLNKLYLRKGRLFDSSKDDEIIVSEAFANAHRLIPGDNISAIINGKWKKLRIVGIALSPEYIYQIAPGALMPDFKRYAIMWMAETPLSSAYDMQGAFNDVVLTLDKQANQNDVIDELDHLLAPYGGLGAYGRKDQLSNHFLDEELKQLKNTATMFPVIFFGVAAFLLNIVMTRLIRLQREEIANLKAFGYSNLAVGVHYMKLVSIIVALGILAGVGLGAWLGTGLSEIYTEFYRFPYLYYILEPDVVIYATLISFALALFGTLRAIQHAARLPPAQAMRPEPPPLYKQTLIERYGLQRYLSQPTRMIMRQLERRPIKSLLSVIGIAMACGVMVVGNFQKGAIDYMVDIQFRLSQLEDLSVTFTEPSAYNAIYSLDNIPGVNHVEGIRSVPVKFINSQRNYRTSITGVDPGSRLLQILDDRLNVVTIPAEGVVLNDHLAKILHARIGDEIQVEVLEGNRPIRTIRVVGLAKQFLGMAAYMQRRTLNRFMREGDAINSVNMSVAQKNQLDVYRQLQNMPRVVGTAIRKVTIQNFYDLLAESVIFFTFIATLLGGVIAFGVVYNNARIALAERSRELASLRVLGFTRAEVGYILIGELMLLTIIAIPLGMLIGYGLVHLMVANLQTDLYRVPLILERSNYAYAALVVIVSSLISSILIWRNIRKLDLIAVLKTKE